MAKVDHSDLGPISRWWIGLYCFAAFWLLLVASLDASHFGPGFFPMVISLVLVPLLAITFLFDMFARVVDAIIGKRASLVRRLCPLVVSVTGFVVYGGICVLFLLGRT